MFRECFLLSLFKNEYLFPKSVYLFSTKANVQPKQTPIISCRRKEFDCYPGETYSKLDEFKLASKGWHHRKSKGDYFILHMNEQTLDSYQSNTTFEAMGLDENLTERLKSNGILVPTLIQSKAIPLILKGRNTLIAAETGCGKTLAYLLPALQQILALKAINARSTLNSPYCLILAPSRELVYQIKDVTDTIVDGLDISTETIVGGGTKRKMMNPTFKETDLLISTLGALSKLVTTEVYKIKDVHHVILDEADTMLDDSFSEKLSYFLQKFPFRYSQSKNIGDNQIGTQLTLASATMPVQYPDSLSDIIIPDSLVRVTTDNLHHIMAHVPQRFLRMNNIMKPPQLLQIVKSDTAKSYPIMIFSNKSSTCDWISMFLNENGVNCINLNGDMSLELRKDKFRAFQRGDVNVISCTDVGSRGLDTIRVKHVINYEFPKYTADYIHRCGRTGRIGSPENCHVTNFISGYHEINLVQKIERAVRKEESLPNVNGNIAGIINERITRYLESDS